MFDLDLLPITDSDIIKEVSKELNIDISDVTKTYDIWIKYLKFISKETDQAMIDFPELGKMYFSTERCKNITSKKDKEYRNLKMENIRNMFEGVEYKNNHEDIPIVHRWGVGRPNYFEYGTHNFTTEYICNKQNEKYYKENNKFLK